MGNQQTAMTVTIHNPTAAQLEWLAKKFTWSGETTEETPVKTKKTKPLKTAAEDTESEMDEDDLSSDDAPEDELSEEDEMQKDADDEDDDTDGLSFDEVKAALNKYGVKHPDEAKAILLGFNIKSTKELKNHQKKWEPVYRKVMAKLKKMKAK